jgi:hypothetical protein
MKFIIIAYTIIFLTNNAVAETLKIPKHDVWGSPIEVSIISNKQNEKPIGIDIYEVTSKDNVGTAFLIKTAYYRLDKKKITEDTSYYRIVGFKNNTSMEIQEKSHSKTWQVSNELDKFFLDITRQVSSNKLNAQEIKKIYKIFDSSPFITDRSEQLNKRQLGDRKLYWLQGLQKIDDMDILLKKSDKYGNIFNASIVE